MAEKQVVYLEQLNRFLTFKSKMEYHHPLSVKTIPPVPPSKYVPLTPTTPNEPAEITPPMPATPKRNFLPPPATEQERPKLKRNFFQADPTYWSERVLVRISAKAREEYEQFFSERLTKIYSNETRTDSKVFTRR